MHIGIAVLIGILIVTFVAQRTIVHDISMQPTLVEGDNLIVEKLGPKLGGLKRGNIIVFYSPERQKQLIKRLIAVEGDMVEIKGGKVYVNGNAAAEYLNRVETVEGLPEFSNLKVPKGTVYVLGDNRSHSEDSRVLGPIDKKQLKGRAIFRFYPFSKIGIMK